MTASANAVEIPLRDLCQSITDGDHQAPPRAASGVPFITISAMRKGSVDLDQAVRFVPPAYAASLDENRKPKTGDILYSVTGSIGLTALVGDQKNFVFQRHIAILRPDQSICDPRWLSCILVSPQIREQADAVATGTAQLTVPLAGLRNFRVPLLSLTQQRDVVAKLDALKARTSYARAELERTTKLTMRLRRTTLTDAFSGALTRDFRSSRDEQDVVMQPDLDDQERGTWINAVLPQSWAWVSFDDFFEDWTDSQRKILEKDYLERGRFPVVDQGRKFVGGFCDDESMVQRVTLPAIVFGDHTKSVKFVEQLFVQGADGTKVLRATSGIDARFAYYALMTLEIPAKGYSRHMKFVRRSVWPRPSLDEQREIVARVEAAFARADRLEAETARATKLLDRLEASILAKAFRGELVPQDPADEPASALLDRIRTGRAAAPQVKRGRRVASATSN